MLNDEMREEERQAWLLEQLRNVIQHAGAAHFMQAPILEPTPAHFPEEWSPDLEGAITITRRLLDHAGLGMLDLDVVEFVNVMPKNPEDTWHVAGFFEGIEAGVCRFGVNVPLLGDPEYLVGVMAHEVAHAFRTHHALRVSERDTAEQLTDLTTAYLGGALITGNLTERVLVERSPTNVSLQRSKSGYLEVEDFAFLLAVQLRARDCSDDAFRRLSHFLGSAQRYCLDRCWRALPLTAPQLRERLGILSEASSVPFVIAPAAIANGTPRWTRPWGQTAYAARRSKAASGLLVGFAIAFLLMCVIRSESTLFTWAILPLLGALAGRFLPKLRCSQCRAVLDPRARECPACSSFILAVLRYPPTAFAVGDHRRSFVRRVRGHRGGHYAAWIGAACMLLGLAPVALGGSFKYAALGLIAGSVLGFIIGRRIRVDTCGGAHCEAPLELLLKSCPRCLGEIRGEAATKLETL